MTGGEIGAAMLFSSLIGAGSSAIMAHEQKSAMKSAEEQRKQAQNQLMQQQAQREEKMKIEEMKKQQMARKKVRASTKGGRADTILTSPLGYVGEEEKAGKTLLGA